MAHAVRFYTAAERADNPGADMNTGHDKWDVDSLHQRVEDAVFDQGFPRVLAGDTTDPGYDDRDQENRVSLNEGDIDDQPARFVGLYRTADNQDS